MARASSSCASAASTAVQAAQLTTTSGFAWPIAAATAEASVMSRSARARGVKSSPRAASRSTTSRPSIPPAPVTSQRVIAWSLSCRCGLLFGGRTSGRGRAAQRLPPVAVRGVPLDGGLEAVGERRQRGVAHRAEQRVVEAVAAVVGLAVLDRHHVVPGRAELVEDGPGELAVGQLNVAVDVVDLARPPLLEHQLDAPAVVVHEDPAAAVQAVAVERERLGGAQG